MESNHPPLFEGCGTALITPMLPSPSLPDGGYVPPAVDFEGFTHLVRRQLQSGVNALIVCGTTGESSTLTDPEKKQLFAITVREARAARTEGRITRPVPVLAGSGSNNTSRAIVLSRIAEEAGCDGLLVVTPYYNKASQAGLIAHFTAIADAVHIPLILYHVPSRTGCHLSTEVCRELSLHPRIAGLKEASGDVSFAARVIHLCGPRLPVYSGNDDLTVPLLSLGGRGVISVVSNLYPGPVSDMCRQWREGDTVGAGRIQRELLPLCDALFSDVNPIPIKAALSMEGLCHEAMRLPLTHAGEEVRRRVREAIDACPYHS